MRRLLVCLTTLIFLVACSSDPSPTPVDTGSEDARDDAMTTDTASDTNDTWTELGAMPEDRERGSSAIANVDGTIYVAGGLRSGAVDDVSSYDPDTDTWTSLESAPRPFDHAG